ncbi:MAG: TIGR02147 family protein [Deltaproteobacteria bacterium]
MASEPAIEDESSSPSAPDAGAPADGENTIERPAPEAFDDYRSYLREMIVYLKATKRQFSYRYFSRVAGFRSPNFLQLVAEGKRNLSNASIAKFAVGLGLDEREQETFETLVMLGQATTDAERNRYYLRLKKQRDSVGTGRIEEAQYEVYAEWFILAVREMLLLPDFVEDPAWIARRLRPEISPADAKRALDLLQEVGLVVRDAEGRLRSSQTKLSTGPKVRSLAIRNFHRAMLEEAAQTLDTVAINKRDITALTFVLSPRKYDLVRARIEQCRRDLLDMIDDDELAEEGEDAPEVYHLAMQLFPLTRKT